MTRESMALSFEGVKSNGDDPEAEGGFASS